MLTLSVVLAALAQTSCRCQAKGGSGLSAAAWSAPTPFQLGDESLADAQYVALGLPAHDHHWSGEDLHEAAVHLQALATTKPRSLPRYRSARSGRVFARIIARDNLEVLRNPAAPISIRLPAALVYTHELNGIYEIYAAALRAKTVTGDDLAELHAARLRACHTMLELAEEFLPTLAPTDPKYQTRLDGITAMRNGTADAMLAALHALVEPLAYGLPARKRLVSACRDTFPLIAPRLPVARRDVLLQELRTTATQPTLANLQPDLGVLQDEVTSAVAAVPARPNP